MKTSSLLALLFSVAASPAFAAIGGHTCRVAHFTEVDEAAAKSSAGKPAITLDKTDWPEVNVGTPPNNLMFSLGWTIDGIKHDGSCFPYVGWDGPHLSGLGMPYPESNGSNAIALDENVTLIPGRSSDILVNNHGGRIDTDALFEANDRAAVAATLGGARVKLIYAELSVHVLLPQRKTVILDVPFGLHNTASGSQWRRYDLSENGLKALLVHFQYHRERDQFTATLHEAAR